MKKQLRKQVQAMLAALPPETAAIKSRRACRRMIDLPEFRQARTVMLFLSIPGEVDTTELIHAAWQDGKTVLAPKVLMDQFHMLPMVLKSLDSGLTPGSYNIREPAGGEPWPLGQIDLVVVPGLAFDRSGQRLGRGGGFYDRFLAQPEIRAAICGLAFREQWVPRLPRQPHDRPVGIFVSDEEIVRFAQKEGPSKDHR